MINVAWVDPEVGWGCGPTGKSKVVKNIGTDHLEKQLDSWGHLVLEGGLYGPL